MNKPLRLAHHAMATQFEILFDSVGSDEMHTRQAAQAAFDEIDALEKELSKFIASSDIARLGSIEPGTTVTVGLATYDCLRLAKAVHGETGGAFDITVGPLMNLWRNEDGTLREVPEDEFAAAKERTGIHLFEIDPEAPRITVTGPGLSLDLGAVGKGYALDQCAELLREWETPPALLNSGDSTVLALGKPADSDGWIIGAGRDDHDAVTLTDSAISASGFEFRGSHIIDPRSGKPVMKRDRHVWALAPTAAMADALSTSFMVLDDAEIETVCARHETISWLSAD